MKKKIEIEFEPIIIYDETPREMITQIFKKHKQLIFNHVVKATNLNKSTITSELVRMTDDGLVTKEIKTVLTNPKHQARSMTVWTWIENGHK